MKLETTDIIQKSDGKFLVATWGGGVILFDQKLNPQLYLSYKNGKRNSIAEPGDRAWSMIEDQQKRIWIGCQHSYLTIVDKDIKSFSQLHPPSLGNYTILNMHLDSRQNIWLSLYAGIGKYDPEKNIFSLYQNFHPVNEVQSATSSDILPDKNGNIWVATLGLGLQKFDPAENKFTEMYVPEKNNPQSIPSQVINCMTPINDSMMAMGTASGGIAIFNSHTKKFFTISASDGLPSNNISALYFVPPATIWAAMINRICKVDLVTKNVTRFGAEDGIRDIDFSSCHHMYRSADGRIFVGYTGGFLYFHPDSVSNREKPANIILTGIKIFDHPYSIDSFSHHSDTVQLSYKQNFLTIYFASLSYLQSSRINYYYQLEGVDKNWVNAHDQRFATYTNLQGGSYVFKVKCANTEGVEANTITSLVLIIHPPFWTTWWFELLLVIGLAAILYFFYRYRINQLLRVQSVRNAISKDLHDDVGATLSSITILSKVANDKINDGLQEQSSAILSKINSYSEDMVEKMGDIVWAVNSSHESVSDILSRLKNFFVETAASKNIHMEFSIGTELEKKNLPMNIRRNIYLICKEAINNAMKYAFCSTIKVALQMEEKMLKLDISDNGVGFDQNTVKNGNGLSNMKARAAEMKAILEISSTPAGTHLSIRLPIPRFR
ncbi:MAG TPA: triple tyrosine motif-containing protein [Puia sp.]|nr:triple tyrosine motif-containing protein [Puia sp.]